MGRSAPMHLSEDERDHVQGFVRRGKDNARTLTQARVLLKSDASWTDAEIAKAFDISEQTIRTPIQPGKLVAALSRDTPI